MSEAFEEKLAALASSELPHARRDPERLALMIERLAATLGLTIAVGAEGDAATAATLLEGARHYLDEEVAERLPIGRLTGGLR